MSRPGQANFSRNTSRAVLDIADVSMDSHVRTLFDEPTIAVGTQLSCCGKGCNRWVRVFSMDLQRAGLLVAAIQHDAQQQGLDMALQAAVDQGHAHIKGRLPDA